MKKNLKNLLQAEIDPAYAKRAEAIIDAVFKQKPEKVLEVGCGRGFYLNALTYCKSPQRIVGVDINQKYLDQIDVEDSRVEAIQASAYQLPFADNEFDFVICSEVLEHLKHDRQALRELHRVLKPDGSLVVTVPHYNFPFFWDPLNWVLMRTAKTHINKDIWWLAGIWAGHERLYTPHQLNNKLSQAGFKVIDEKHLIHHCWPFTHFLLYGLGKNLVEKLNLTTFNRFASSPSRIDTVLAKCIKAPSLVLDSKFPTHSFQNIFIQAKLAG